MILPGDGDVSTEPLFAGCHPLNGDGELTGLEWIREAGLLTSPIGLTNTHSVGTVRDALVAASARERRRARLFWSLPVVGETYDGILNDINGFHVRAEHVDAALAAAAAGQVPEGAVGGGTGMICHGFKGGIGTASRVVAAETGGFTVGVLVQANHGRRERLQADGVPVGRRVTGDEVPVPEPPEPVAPGSGSIIGVVGTDAPLLPHQCARLAQRAGLGVARTGGVGEHTSGDLFLAFAIGNRGMSAGEYGADDPLTVRLEMLSDRYVTPLFDAVVEATEEAIVNALLAAGTMNGRDGVVAYGPEPDRLPAATDRRPGGTWTAGRAEHGPPAGRKLSGARPGTGIPFGSMTQPIIRDLRPAGAGTRDTDGSAAEATGAAVANSDTVADADAAAAAAVLRASLPYLISTPELLAWEVRAAPTGQRYRLLVAEVDGRIVGTARTGLVVESGEPGQAFANVNVHPDHRDRGAGTALAAAAEEYLAGLGARTVYCWVLDDERSTAFAERRGYRRGRASVFQRLDLAAGPLPPLTAPPAGVELGTAADLAADPRPLYEADVEAAADEPGDVATDAIGYRDWLSLYWDRPDLDRGLTSVALVDGVVAAFSLAQTDGRGRYWSGMTGTRRAYRGRGLAKLAKNHSLHRAREAGCTEAYTGNDTGNEPMLAINRWLGYQRDAGEWRYRLDLR